MFIVVRRCAIHTLAQKARVFRLRGPACVHTLVWPLPHRPVQLGWTCQECETPTDIALGVIEAHKPSHHFKVHAPGDGRGATDTGYKHLCCILFCQLCRLGKIRPFLSTDVANKFAVSFVLTRLDYCNSLLAGLPDNKLNKLQRIQNHAARKVLRKPSHVSATSLLRTLRWLPVKVRIQYKIACLCFQCLSHNTMPPYLSDILHPYQPPRTLRSLDTSLLSVPRFCQETFGRRSFSVFGPTVWNSLPLSLRKTQCFSTFKNKLKTHLFEKHIS